MQISGEVQACFAVIVGVRGRTYECLRRLRKEMSNDLAQQLCWEGNEMRHRTIREA